MVAVRKELKDMTLEELWALFPIVLVPHKEEWKEWAEEEIAFLSDLLSDFSPVINHIGSTAIPTIWAKPIIDILVEVPCLGDTHNEMLCLEPTASEKVDFGDIDSVNVKDTDGIKNNLQLEENDSLTLKNNTSPSKSRERIKEFMVGNGYICMSESGDGMSFNKGYTPEGYAERVFHIHFHRVGDNDEVYFRDYLITHPDVAKEYEVLKLGLLPEYRNDRDGYTEAKTDFVRNITVIAKS